METLISSVSLEQLGVSAILVAYLMYHNHCMRKELQTEREYGKAQSELYQGLALKTIETMARLENGFLLLRDTLK